MFWWSDVSCFSFGIQIPLYSSIVIIALGYGAQIIPKLFGTLHNIQQDQISPSLKRAELCLALEQKNQIKVIHTEG